MSDPDRRPDRSGSVPDRAACPHCGAQVSPDLEWCPQCLRPLESGPAPAPAAAARDEAATETATPAPGHVTPETLRAAQGTGRDPSKPDWGALGPRPTTRWHATATTSGPAVKVGLTALVAAVLVAAGLLLPWGRFAPLSGFILIAATALALVFLASLWRKGEVEAPPGEGGSARGEDVRPPA